MNPKELPKPAKNLLATYRWEELLEEIRARPAVSESEMVLRAIDFANQDTLKAYFKFLVPAVDAPDPAYDAAPLPEDQRTLQEQFRSALRTIVDGKVTPEREAIWCRIASGVVMIPEHTFRARKLRTTYRYEVAEVFTVDEPNGLFALMLVWLLEPEREFDLGAKGMRRSKHFSYCHLPSCGKFFFAEPPETQGKWLTKYCGPKHKEEAEALQARERARKWRKVRSHK